MDAPSTDIISWVGSMIKEIEPHATAGFSQGLLVSGISGIAFASVTARVQPGERMRKSDLDVAFDQLGAELRKQGFDLPDVAAMTVMLADVEDMEVFRSVRSARLGGRKPASSVVIAEGFESPSERCSIELIAVR